MGRTWKFTEQIYEELRENVEKKITTQFTAGVLGAGEWGVFGNPFEKYADEINMGISKMNTYVDMMNEAEGFNKAKLDRVFEQIAEVDQNYGSQIEKCTEDIVHYNKVLEQLVGVMEQAFSGSSNGNAIFEFDREAFRDTVRVDKNAMDIAYVDRILLKDMMEITYDEYYSIAVLIGNQPIGDTALVEYILNRTDMWEFVNASILEGNDPSNITPGQPSTGVFIPSEKYQALSAMLSIYAYEVTMGKPENAEGTPYINFMNNVVMYEQLFRGIVINTVYNEWGYMTGSNQEGEMVNLHIGNMFQIKYENGEIVAMVQGEFGENRIVSHTYVEDESVTESLVGTQNLYINSFLDLDKSGTRVGLESILEGLRDEAIGHFIEVNPAMSLVIGAATAGYEHEQTQNAILNYEEWGNYADTFQLLELGYSHCQCDYGADMPSNSISAYPSNETVEVLGLLNAFLESDEVKKEKYMDVMAKIPDGGFTLDYVLNHMGETDSILDELYDVITNPSDGEKYANSLAEAIGKEK